jgi:predicted nucleic acid-binding protein
LFESGCVDWRHVLGSRQFTDVFILALAARRGGRLVTFDRVMPLASVENASKAHLESI